MNSMSRTAAVYGLTVPPDDDPIECYDDDTIQGEIHVTMAAIDPTAAPASDAPADSFKGATLKMIILPPDFDDEGSDDDDLDMDALLNGEASDDSDDSDDEDLNGGPSDPERSPKALKHRKLLEELKMAREEEEDDDDRDVDMLDGLSAKAKGKAREIELDEDEDDDSDEAIDLGEPKELVLCSLDLTRTYQQPLNITIPLGGRVFFKASGTHNVYLSGNISAPWDDGDSEDDEYDLSPDEDELDMPEDEDESDELDDIDDPRIQELDSDEEEVPKLIKGAEAKKGKNKRAADESDEETTTGLDKTLAKAIKAESSTPVVNGEEKLTKKQRKKLKANGGNAVEVSTTSKDSAAEDLGVKEVASGVSKQSTGKQDKKVQFAKTLVQGPTSSVTTNGEMSKSDVKSKAGDIGSKQTNAGGSKPSLGVKTIQGVTVDDKKLGSGPQAKKGDRVSMRYIGKLEDKRVFDSNKKGPPFSFKVGSGEVIKGWDFGVSGMSAGGERRMTIPPQLAYGSKALPGIPKNSTLIFDVKLLEIK